MKGGWLPQVTNPIMCGPLSVIPTWYGFLLLCTRSQVPQNVAECCHSVIA